VDILSAVLEGQKEMIRKEFPEIKTDIFGSTLYLDNVIKTFKLIFHEKNGLSAGISDALYRSVSLGDEEDRNYRT